MSDSLKQYRDRIDALDDEILELLNKRAGYAKAVGNLKKDGRAYRAEREAQVLRRLAERSAGPLTPQGTLSIFTEIMSVCRALEATMSVAFLGPEGTFSEEAAVKHFGSAISPSRYGTVDDVFRNVETNNDGYGVVPVENSSEGAVDRTLDLLLSSPLKICGEVMLPVHQCLLSKGSMTEIDKVFSHAQSLAQCREWLHQHLPNAELTAVSSNAQAALCASRDDKAAAIVSKVAASLYGLNVLAESIEAGANNTTRFLVLCKHDAAPSGKDKTSLVVSTKNQPGAVHRLLTPLAKHQVSMSKLESRPSKAGLWEYVFFIDLDGHREDENVARAINEITQSAAFLKVLGSYPAVVF